MSFGGGDVASLGIGLGVDPASFDAYGGITVPGTDVSVDPTVQGMVAYDSLAPLGYNESANQADQATIGVSEPAPFSPDAEMAEAALRDNSAEFNTLRAAEGGMLYADPLIDLPVLSFLGPRTIKNAIGRTMPAQTVLANLPYVGGLLSGAMTSGYADNTFGDFPGDAISTPSAEDIAAVQQQMQPVMPEPEPVPVVVAAPTASQVYATAQPYYRRTLLDAAPAGFADFAALNDAFNRSYAMRPAIYQTPPAVDLLGRQGFVPLA
jgi:hypothetical protein